MNLERGLPQGAAESLIIFANGPRTRGQTMRRAMGKERLGLLGRREEMGERELRGRHLSHQRNMIRDITTELEAVGLVSAQTRHTGHHSLRNLIQWEQVLVFVGMTLDLSGSSWASIRHSTHLQVKVCEWRKRIRLITMSVLASVHWEVRHGH